MNKFVLLLLGSLSLVPAPQAGAGNITNSDILIVSGPGAPIPDTPIDFGEPKREAVEVSIGSIGGELDAAVISTVRQVVGHAVTAGVVSTFVDTTNKGGFVPFEGGLSFCAEKVSSFLFFEPFGSDFERFVNQLESIQPQSGTFYNIDKVDRCPATIIND